MLDKQQVQSGSSQKDYLINNGINVKVCKSKVQHTKIIIIDDKAVFTGSYNLTNNARKKNNETLNVLESEKDIMSISNILRSDWGSKIIRMYLMISSR